MSLLIFIFVNKVDLFCWVNQDWTTLVPKEAHDASLKQLSFETIALHSDRKCPVQKVVSRGTEIRKTGKPVTSFRINKNSLGALNIFSLNPVSLARGREAKEKELKVDSLYYRLTKFDYIID